MLKGVIPISSLKRDEIYTFITGIYVSALWFIYLYKASFIYHNNGLSLYQTCYFIIVWLFSTAALFLIATVMSSLIDYSLYNYCASKSNKYLANILKISENEVTYFTLDFNKDKFVYKHIYAMCISAIILTLYPYSKLSNNINYGIIAFVLSILLAIIFFYYYHKTWLNLYCYFVLKKRGLIDVFDDKKYSEQISIALANNNITSTINANLQKHITITEYKVFLDSWKETSETTTWRWEITVKLDNSTNDAYLNKHAAINSILLDENHYLIAMSCVKFDDYDKISIDIDKTNTTDNNNQETIIKVKQICEITVEKAKLYHFSKCFISYD